MLFLLLILSHNFSHAEVIARYESAHDVDTATVLYVMTLCKAKKKTACDLTIKMVVSQKYGTFDFIYNLSGHQILKVKLQHLLPGK